MPRRPIIVGTIDRHVGEVIRTRRELMGLTPESFAARLGCEPALILDYEAGRSRADASTLMRLSRLCEVDIGSFLAGLRRAG